MCKEIIILCSYDNQFNYNSNAEKNILFKCSNKSINQNKKQTMTEPTHKTALTTKKKLGNEKFLPQH